MVDQKESCPGKEKEAKPLRNFSSDDSLKQACIEDDRFWEALL